MTSILNPIFRNNNVLGDISSHLQWVAANPWFTLVTAACTLVAVPLTIILYVKSKKDKLPRYAVRSINIIKETHAVIPAVSVHFEGHSGPIANLTVSKVAFWNSGRETIRKQDVVRAQGIVLKAKGDAKILDAEIIQRTTVENNIDTTKSQDKTQATLTFEYIDRNEGVVIQVFHTGIKDDDLEVVGKIMGAGCPRRIFISHPNRGRSNIRRKYSRRLETAKGVVFVCLPIVYAYLMWWLSRIPQEVRIARASAPVSPTPWIILACFIFALSWFAAYMILRPTIPRGLDLFYEDA